MTTVRFSDGFTVRLEGEATTLGQCRKCAKPITVDQELDPIYGMCEHGDLSIAAIHTACRGKQDHPGYTPRTVA